MRHRYFDLKREMIDKIKEATQEVEADIREQYAERLAEALEELKVIRNAQGEDRARINASATVNGDPVGTVFERMKVPSLSRHRVGTGEFAVLEVYREGDPLPLFMADWRIPKHGDLIMRSLKKDGSRGKHVERVRYDIQSRDTVFKWRATNRKVAE